MQSPNTNSHSEVRYRIHALCHATKTIQEQFKNGNKGFAVLTWPPNSPALSQIKNLGDVLGKQVKILLQQPLRQITQQIFRGLVESTPQSIKVALVGKEVHTEYFMVVQCGFKQLSVRQYRAHSLKKQYKFWLVFSYVSHVEQSTFYALLTKAWRRMWC